MLQGIRVELGEHAVERAALGTQALDLEQQLQQEWQRIEAAQGLATKLETRRPIQWTVLATAGEDQWPPTQAALLDHADFDQADIVLQLAAKIQQRLLNFREQLRRLPIGGEHPVQAPLAEQLALLVAGFQYAIGQQENP